MASKARRMLGLSESHEGAAFAASRSKKLDTLELAVQSFSRMFLTD